MIKFLIKEKVKVEVGIFNAAAVLVKTFSSITFSRKERKKKTNLYNVLCNRHL